MYPLVLLLSTSHTLILTLYTLYIVQENAGIPGSSPYRRTTNNSLGANVDDPSLSFSQLATQGDDIPSTPGPSQENLPESAVSQNVGPSQLLQPSSQPSQSDYDNFEELEKKARNDPDRQSIIEIAGIIIKAV